MKGGRETLLGSDSGRNEQSGLNCTGRAPSPRGPGYHMVYGETTKHAPEASVIGENPRWSSGTEGVSRLPDLAWLTNLGWRAREAVPGGGLALLSRRPERPGVQHAT
jgi:hypothetical protein